MAVGEVLHLFLTKTTENPHSNDTPQCAKVLCGPNGTGDDSGATLRREDDPWEAPRGMWRPLFCGGKGSKTYIVKQNCKQTEDDQ